MSAPDDGGPADPAARLRTLVHDLRTPLMVVGGFADLLVSRGEGLSPEERADFARRIAEGAREMRELLDAERAERHGA